MSKTSKNSEKRMWAVGGDRSCPHDSLERLGSDRGNNLYLKCHRCKGVLIVEGEYSYEEERQRLKESAGKENFLEKMINR